MNRTLHIFASVAGLTVVGGAAGAQTGATCAFTMQVDMGQGRVAGPQGASQAKVAIQGRAWQLGRKARIEMTMGGRNPRVTVVTENALYSLRPDQHVVTKKPLTPEAAAKLYDAFPLLFLHPVDPAARWKGSQKIGQETIDGKPCDIWKVTLPGAIQQETKMWIPRSSRPAAPIKAEVAIAMGSMTESKLNVKAPKLAWVSSASDVRLNTSVPASLFAVPKGYAVQTRPAMGLRVQAVPGHGPGQRQRRPAGVLSRG